MIRIRRRLVLASCVVVFALAFHPSALRAAARKPAPSLGVVVVGLYPELAADLGLPAGQAGVVVVGVLGGSPAAGAGVKEGDVVVSVQPAGGKAMPVADTGSFDLALDKISARKPVVLTVLRGGQQAPVQFVCSEDTPGTPVQPAAGGEPRVIKVGGSGAERRSIDGALLEARPGDTVAVASGRYPAMAVARDRVTIVSQEPGARAVVAGITLAGVSDVTLENLDLEAMTAGSGVGIGGVARRVTITGCAIKGFADGVSLSGQELTLEGNRFSGNGLAIHGTDTGSSWKIRQNLVARNTGGILVAGNVEISGNTVVENRVSADDFLKALYKSHALTGVGIVVTEPESRALVFNNIVMSNSVGVLLGPNVQATLEYNDILMNRVGPATLKTGWALNDNHAELPATNSNVLTQFGMTTYKIGGNLVTKVAAELTFQPSGTNTNADPLFTDPAAGDYRLSADSPLVGKGRDQRDIGAFPAVGAPAAQGERGARASESEPPAFGIAARALTEADRQALALPSLEGLWVTEVKKGSPADAMQLKVDDIIVAVNNKAFKTADEFKALIASKVDTLTVLRGGKKTTLVKSIVF